MLVFNEMFRKKDEEMFFRNIYMCLYIFDVLGLGFGKFVFIVNVILYGIVVIW